MRRKKRKKLLVDRHVQFALIARCAMYWLMCVATIIGTVTLYDIVTLPTGAVLTNVVLHVRPALIAAAVLLPVLILDMLTISNRFVGPLWRLRGDLRKIAGGECVQPLVFRRGDFWADVADEFNAAVAAVGRNQHADEAKPQTHVSRAG